MFTRDAARSSRATRDLPISLGAQSKPTAARGAAAIQAKRAARGPSMTHTPPPPQALLGYSPLHETCMPCAPLSPIPEHSNPSTATTPPLTSGYGPRHCTHTLPQAPPSAYGRPNTHHHIVHLSPHAPATVTRRCAIGSPPPHSPGACGSPVGRMYARDGSRESLT